MLKSEELSELVHSYIGKPGDFFVKKELETLGFDDLENLNQNQKKSMITLFLLDVFRPILTAEKLLQVRHKLCTIFDVKDSLIR